jgi:hypothetical protein
MNDSNRKVNEVVPMGSDKESALDLEVHDTC